MTKRIMAIVFVMTMIIIPMFSATLTEGFNSTGWGASYGNYTVNSWTLTNVYRETTYKYEGVSAIRFNTNTGGVKSIVSPLKTGGLGTLTFWYRRWSASDGSVLLTVYKSTDGTTWGSSIGSVTASSDTYSQYSLSVNDGSAQYIKVEAASTTKRCLLDFFEITDYSAGNPVITATSSLTPFSTTQGTPSASQTYTIAGANLTANISCVPPTGYEISTSSGSGYTTGTLSLTQSGGSVATTTIYARLTGATAGTPSGTITHNSTGATEVTVAVTGTVYKAEPSNHVTGFEAITADPPYSSVYMAWTDATGTTVPDGYLVKGSAISLDSIIDPVDGIPEANSTLVQNIVAGVEEATFYNLASNTTYYFKVFPYTNSGANVNFKTDGTVAFTSVLTEYGPPVAPVAINATAISHDGFTARWNTVSGATSYRLDVLSGAAAIATDLFISEYVEGSATNKYIEIFNGTGSAVDLSDYMIKLFSNGASTSSSSEATLSGILDNGECKVYRNTASALTLPVGITTTANNTIINFNGDDAIALYKISTSSYVDIFGRIGEDPGSEWGTSPLWTINTTLVRKSTVTGGVTTNPTSGFPTLATEWDNYPTDTASNLGSHTMSNSLTPVSGYDNLTVTGNLKRVDGLNASTDYSYRVRAYNTNGLSDNSNVIVLSTTATTPGVTANTTVGGNSTVFTVPTIGAYTNLDVEIDPDTDSTDDFDITVAEIPTGLTYTISTTNILALNGVYMLNHVGFSAAPTLSVNTGSIEVDASDESSSLVTISGIGTKGDLIITAEDGGTLPVELSSFTATISTQNFVRLMWVTESETNVNGYYIYRGLTDDVSAALLVSDMISATNTSQQTSYMYLDKEIFEDGLYYYWLQNADIDGSSEMHGPVTAQVSLTGGNTTPIVPLVTELQSVYPNPFNPSTFVRYAIATPAHVKIDIYNVRGQLVRSLVNADKAVGNHRIEWNGKDDNGSNCSNGIYYIRMNAGKDNFVRKAVMLK